jgi:signal transduction histidine kinase
LGLASSRAIVEAHEGTIGFEADAAGGTRFWFRLPLAEH